MWEKHLDLCINRFNKKKEEQVPLYYSSIHTFQQPPWLLVKDKEIHKKQKTYQVKEKEEPSFRHTTKAASPQQ